MTDHAALNKSVVLVARPTTLLAPGDTRVESRAMPEIAEGQAMVKTVTLAMDPVTRVVVATDIGIVPPIAIGEPLRSFGAGVVVESRSADLPVGARVAGFLEWSEYQVIAPGPRLDVLPTGMSLDDALNIHGHTAMAAYFGLLEIGQPKAGETLLVSGAAGAVGSVVGQIGRINGLRVGGIAGGSEKCRWLVDELRFDFAVDYKSTSFEAKLADVCCGGIDLFFDNVDGELQDKVVPWLKPGARLIACGHSAHFATPTPLAGMTPRSDWSDIDILRFNAMDYAARFPEAEATMRAWVEQGWLRFAIMRVNGIDQAADALNMLFDGRSRGRVLVDLASA